MILIGMLFLAVRLSERMDVGENCRCETQHGGREVASTLPRDSAAISAACFSEQEYCTSYFTHVLHHVSTQSYPEVHLPLPAQLLKICSGQQTSVSRPLRLLCLAFSAEHPSICCLRSPLEILPAIQRYVV